MYEGINTNKCTGRIRHLFLSAETFEDERILGVLHELLMQGGSVAVQTLSQEEPFVFHSEGRLP